MSKAEKFWDSQAGRFDAQAEEDDPTLQRTIEITMGHLKASDVVLDYACGPGTSTIAIAAHVQEIVGLDISSKMIEIAKRKAEARNIANAHFAQATIFDAQYKVGSYDVILAFNVLHLLENRQEVLQRIHDLLKPGGLFISATACLGEKRSFFSMFLQLVSKFGLIPHLQSLTIAELKNSVVNAKLQIVEAETLSQSPVEYFIVARKMESVGE